MSVTYHDPAKAVRRLWGFLALVIGVFLMVGLFYVRTGTQTAEREMKRVERALATEEAAIAVLRAEIAHLESPARVSELAQDLLQTAPAEAEQIILESELDAYFPLKETAP